MNQRAVIFVAGTDLSGSTVLDLALGSLPGIVGLGEIDNILVPSKKMMGEAKNGPIEDQICTCGEIGTECEVWGPVLLFLNERPSSRYTDRYRLLLDTVSKATPQATTVVDSSKEAGALERLLEQVDTTRDGTKLTTILVRRGPISWLLSDNRRAARRGLLRNQRIRRRRVRKWSQRYTSLDRLIRDNNIPTLRISLRSFQYNPNNLVDSLVKVFDMKSVDGARIDIAQTSSHVLWGSHHRHAEATSREIKPQEKAKVAEFLGALSVVMSVPQAILTNLRLVLREIVQQR